VERLAIYKLILSLSGQFDGRQWRGALVTTLCINVGYLLTTDRWCFPCT